MRATSSWLDTWNRFSPDAEALVDLGTGRRWTYAQLHHDARAWAGWLSRRGVGRGDVVAVVALNRGETLALLFACADLGAILFPMNWRLAPAEAQWQLGHSGASVVIADETNAHLVPDAHPLETPDLQDVPEPVEVPLDAPWMLMYTSGSSGRPKGALLTHRMIHWNAFNTALACDLTRNDSTLTFAPLFHTGGMNSLTSPLLHRGGRVILTPKLDAAETLSTIEKEGITLLMGVPTIYQMLADHPDFATTDLSSVRDALCGGAPLPLPLLERYAARDIPLRQGFGLTEVGVNCFSLPHAFVREKSGSVGLPIHHIAAKIVRDDGTECAVDEPGELLLKGPVVCGGYWRDEAATDKAIVDGWFYTGDVLSKDADGFFYVRGRKKEMYISGGENVYPAEVEAVIAEADGVALVAVVGVPDERWGEVGHAYVEAQPGRTLDPDDIARFLDGRLARFKRPKRIVVLPELPRTGSGKIDKQALAEAERPLIVLLLAACLPDDWDGYHTDTDVVDTDVDTDTSVIDTGSGGQDPALARTWVSEGADLSDLFAGAGITRVEAVFRANGTYTVTSRDASGQQGVFTGTYVVDLGATPHDIELYQDAPYTAESVGIYRVNNDTLTYEAVQTLPDYGNTPPDGSFGTSSGPGISSGENVQTYRVAP